MDAYWPQIVLVYSFVLLGLASPGPNILSIVATSMSAGRRAGVAMALGISAGSFIWACLTAVGLTALIAAYASIMLAIKIAGGLYLLWLALKAFRASLNPLPIAVWDGPATASIGRFFGRGLLVQLTNPKAALTWIVTISLGMDATAPLGVVVVIIVGATILSVAAHLLYALAFSTGRVVAIYGRARRGIEFFIGTFFTLAGMKLLTSRI